MIPKETIEIAYSFLHQKRNVYIHSTLKDHARFEEDITSAVNTLERMLELK